MSKTETAYFVYILYSSSIDKYYTGFTEDYEKRFAFHNSEKNRIWTKRGRPWELKKVFRFDTKREALQAEKFIKQQRNRAYMERFIENEDFRFTS